MPAITKKKASDLSYTEKTTPRSMVNTPTQRIIANGTLEVIKWVALILMTGDHINKYLLKDQVHWLFDLGRLVMPMFGFVLAYNLARAGAAATGLYDRIIKRLVMYALLSTPAFIALGGLLYGWWPLNIMFTLLITAISSYLIFERPGWKNKLLGVAAIIIGGGFVEFWWPAILMNLAFVAWFKYGRIRYIIAAFFSAFFLVSVNANQWALMAFPILLAVSSLKLTIPRIRWVFYVYYPALLYVLFVVRYVFILK